MRLLWKKFNDKQLDLLGVDAVVSEVLRPAAKVNSEHKRDTNTASASLQAVRVVDRSGLPLILPVSALEEDPANPRTEFPDADLEELAEDIRQRGILQPIVVHPADANGRHRIHFGAKRLLAAQRAGIHEVPVVIRDAPADPYTQVAENQKRHGLTQLDLARFIRRQVDAGDSNTTVAKRLGMNLTTVAHHLALLDLPAALDQALKSGRCTSPRTLHELSKLHADNPEQVQSLLASGSEITRTAVSALPTAPEDGTATEATSASSNKLIAQANAACDRLERALGRIRPSNSYKVALPELIALRIRVEDITKRWLQGSDRQTPAQPDR
jgi:ParB family chromosome partitioning protein